jgi:hypothetical protein
VKKSRIFIGIVLCALSITAVKPAAAFEELSLGLAAPSPTGISAKLWSTRLTAYDLFAEWDIGSEKFNFHMDYIRHDYERLDTKESDMIFYTGYGVRLLDEGIHDDTIFGVRVPFGISYLMDDPPLDVFGELAPRVNLVPSTNFGIDVMIGFRYRLGIDH